MPSKGKARTFPHLWYAKAAEEAARSLVVECEDQAELDRYWDALLAGGGEPQACGWLIDRFGVRWQIVPAAFEVMMRDPDRARSKRVTDAMLQVVKIDIATLERAYDG